MAACVAMASLGSRKLVSPRTEVLGMALTRHRTCTCSGYLVLELVGFTNSPDDA